MKRTRVQTLESWAKSYASDHPGTLQTALTHRSKTT